MGGRGRGGRGYARGRSRTGRERDSEQFGGHMTNGYYGGTAEDRPGSSRPSHGGVTNNERTANSHVSNGISHPGQPPLTNFFNFAAAPLPQIPRPPERWTNGNGASVEVDSWAAMEKAEMREGDENKNYVEHYTKLIEKKIRKMWTNNELMQQQENSEKIPSRDNESILGSVMGGTAYEQRGADEVFWKYKMDEKLVDTSHLMINNYKQTIIDLLETRQVLIVEGFTGCGKTTQVPQFILNDAAANGKHVNIVVTQPRRIAAISVASRVCEERGWNVGGLVGYQVGMDKKSYEDTRIVYMTTGVLLKQLINKKNMTEYSHIIIDEVHERDVDTDLLLLVIKKIIIDRGDSNTKIILMSATLDAQKFSKYFPLFDPRLEKPEVVTVNQPAQFEVKERFLDEIGPTYGYEGFDISGTEEPRLYQDCTDLACKIINSLDYLEYEEVCKTGAIPMVPLNEAEIGSFTTSVFYKDKSFNPPPRGAVLVFLPGLLEIDTMYKQLNELSLVKAGSSNSPDIAKWTVYPLHSSINNDEQQMVFKPPALGFRKIILATNIAESSITVSDIKYVIDFCLTKSLSRDPSTNYVCLRMEWASRNQCIQRRGRCGRVAPGICYRLISRSFYYNVMPQEALPEMEKASLESVILNVKNLQMGTPCEVLALAVDPPQQSCIRGAVANLKEVGALTVVKAKGYDAYDGDMTFMGDVMSKLPIDFRLGRLIVLGHVLGMVDDAIIIAAALSTKSPCNFPYGKRLEAWLAKFNWSNRTHSDLFAVMNAFKEWERKHRERAFHNFKEEKLWAKSMFLQINVLKEIRITAAEIEKRLQSVQIYKDSASLSNMDQGLIFKLLIAGAFYPNYFIRSRPDQRQYERNIIREVSGGNPMTTVTLAGFPSDQPPSLYAKILADKLTHATSVPHVEVCNSKVTVVFDPRGDKVGCISTGVYRALKMRQIRDRVTFLTLQRDDAYKMAEKVVDYAVEHPILPAPKPILPPIQEEELDCFVCYADPTQSPHEFYVIRKEDTDAQNKIKSIISSEGAGRVCPLPSQECFPGAICLILKNGLYWRARVEALLDERQVLVYAIDVGNLFVRETKEVFKVTKQMVDRGLLEYPALALRCRLSELQPSNIHGYDWVGDAHKDFDEFLGKWNNEFTFRIFSVVEGVLNGELLTRDKSDSLNKVLLTKTYLDKTVESRDSKSNFDARRLYKVCRYDEKTIEAHNKKQADSWEPFRYATPPRVDPETGIAAVLRGPNSPLEMNFNALCRSSHMKQVHIDGQSINCVALDSDPFNPCSRVMIAQHVKISHRTGNLVAEETTIMPAIPGLASLLTLLFAPKVEFRLDSEFTRYTGCISGLGTDPIRKQPVYPDHDMDVIFDVHIDNEDLDLINAVRFNFNSLLRERKDPPQILNALREKVRSNIISLLHKQRDSIEEAWPEMSHAWNRLRAVDGVEYYNPSTEYKTTSKDVFSLHTGVCFQQPVEGRRPAVPHNVFQPEDVDWA